jgi:hypothetical protein
MMENLCPRLSDIAIGFSLYIQCGFSDLSELNLLLVVRFEARANISTAPATSKNGARQVAKVTIKIIIPPLRSKFVKLTAVRGSEYRTGPTPSLYP